MTTKTSAEKTALTVLVPLAHVWPGYAPIVLTTALGYAAEEGLDVTNKPAGSPTAALQGVVDGSGDLTFINTAFGFVSRDEGHPFDV